METALRQRLMALPPAARAELLNVLMLPDLERVERIGTYWGHPETRTFGELLIDLEEEPWATAGRTDKPRRKPSSACTQAR